MPSPTTRVAGKKPYSLKIATISDIHLGHDRVSTESILENLRTAFPNTQETYELDLIIIAGDLFHQILNLPEMQVRDIKIWMLDILTLCKKNNIKLRILEGTPSHDRGQGRLFDTVNTLSKLNADCKYVDVLSIEYIKDLDINVLYIPDEWRLDPDDTWNDVKNVMHEHNLDMVDYAVMHGAFEHQYPPFLKISTHCADRYLSIVKKYITIGHVHDMSVKDRILAQGSFDRLAHGEEEAKGHFRINVRDKDKNDLDEIIFVENKNATIFKTISLLGATEEEVNNKLNEVCSFKPHSFIRVIIDKNHISLGLIDSVKKSHPEYVWTINTEDTTDTKGIKSVEFKNSYVALEIRPDDIVSTIVSRLLAKGYNKDLISRATRILESAK